MKPTSYLCSTPRIRMVASRHRKDAVTLTRPLHTPHTSGGRTPLPDPPDCSSYRQCMPLPDRSSESAGLMPPIPYSLSAAVVACALALRPVCISLSRVRVTPDFDRACSALAHPRFSWWPPRLGALLTRPVRSVTKRKCPKHFGRAEPLAKAIGARERTAFRLHPPFQNSPGITVKLCARFLRRLPHRRTHFVVTTQPSVLICAGLCRDW